jgi:hypothetical protein
MTLLNAPELGPTRLLEEYESHRGSVECRLQAHPHHCDGSQLARLAVLCQQRLVTQLLYWYLSP